MIVCLCHRITDRDIQRAAREGIRDFEELQDETCIARNCGCCLETAVDIFEAACDAQAPSRPVVLLRQVATATA